MSPNKQKDSIWNVIESFIGIKKLKHINIKIIVMMIAIDDIFHDRDSKIEILWFKFIFKIIYSIYIWYLSVYKGDFDDNQK